jgi:hypothetical protein
MNVDEVLQRAMNAYSTGTLGQAELLFNQVLAADKQRLDALHMLGVLQSRRRNCAEAMRLAQGARLLARMQVCDWADWNGECERILAGVRQDSGQGSPRSAIPAPCYIDRFRRHMEAAYATMRERQLRSEPPEDFAVTEIEA